MIESQEHFELIDYGNVYPMPMKLYESVSPFLTRLMARYR